MSSSRIRCADGFVDRGLDGTHSSNNRRGDGRHSTTSPTARREREDIGCPPNRTRNANDGWCCLIWHNLNERETRTRGNGGPTPIKPQMRMTHPSNARRERCVEMLASTAYGSSNARHQRWMGVMARNAHTYRTRDANDGWKSWPAQHIPIERETRTTGGIVAGRA